MLTRLTKSNMQPIVQLRKRYQNEFQSAHNGTKLVYVFLCAGSHEALKRFPSVNAALTETILLQNYGIGVAVLLNAGWLCPVFVMRMP